MTWTVTNTGDGPSTCPGPACTLREAVTSAQSGDTIKLPPGVYTINGAIGGMSIVDQLTISGAGASTTTITESSPAQLFYVLGELDISNLTIQGSSQGTSGVGGGAIFSNGLLRVNGVDFVGDTATTPASGPGFGGAIYNNGRAIITGSSFSDDIAQASSGDTGTTPPLGGQGGAIFSVGSLTVSSSTFTADRVLGTAAEPATTGRSVGGRGGAIYAGGRVAITSSTFSGDAADASMPTGISCAGCHGGNPGQGGAVYVGNGGGSINASTFTDNEAKAGVDDGPGNGGAGGDGGAIDLDPAGALTIANSTIASNTADADPAQANGGFGGGVIGNGALTIIDSTISGNTAQAGDGGGIYGLNLELDQSTIGPGNTASTGGGLYTTGRGAVLANDTIDGNTASSNGGGLTAFGTADLLANVSLVANTVQASGGGGDVYVTGKQLLHVHDSLIAAGAGGNCAFSSGGSILSEGYNAEDGTSCGLSGPGDLASATLQLGALAMNGGPTETVALMPGSQAIGAGDPAGCTDAYGAALATDQRGVARPQGVHCDIGAFELAMAPTNTALPAVTGTDVQGNTLSSTTGSWTGNLSGLTRQWQDCNSSGAGCTDIAGATAATHILTFADAGHTLRLLVTATNGTGSTSQSSPPTAVVASLAPALTRVSVHGSTLALTVSEPCAISVKVPHHKLTFRAAAGPDHFKLALRRGSYTATVRARNSFGQSSKPVTVRFKIH
jgi:hypothetical protein